MFKIDEDTFYSRADLTQILKPYGVDVDHFIKVIKPKKVIKMLWLGKHILDAYNEARALAQKAIEQAATNGDGNGDGNGKAKKDTQAARSPTKMQDFIRALNGKTSCVLWFLAAVMY